MHFFTLENIIGKMYPFNDDRLLYTPFFETKLDNYFSYYVSPFADSVINELKYMLLYARTGKQMYPYLLMKFTNQYFNPQHVGQNKVFLYLFNEFYLKGDTILLNPQSKKAIFDRAVSVNGKPGRRSGTRIGYERH